MKNVLRREWRRVDGNAFRWGAVAIAIALPVAAATSRAAAAQALPRPSAPTRLADLYGEVRRANPKIAAAQALARAMLARVPGTTRPPDPQVQLGLMNRSLPRLAPMQTLGMTQLQVMQMVPLGGKLALAGRIADASADAASARAEDVAWELRSRTAMSFYDLYAVDGQLAVARETLALLRVIARTAESMYRVGEGRQADVLRATVEIAKMVDDTLRMQAMRRTMVARLGALLNRDAGEILATVARPRFPETVPSEAWLDSTATTSRPMIRAGLHEVRAADASAGLARKEILPDLQLGVQYARGASTMTDANGMTSTKVEHMGSLMIGASIPIFARERQFEMRREADAMKAMALAEVSAMRAETRGKIGEALAALRRARDLAQLYRTTVLPQADATVASAMASYRVGKVDFMTLLDDQMTANKYRQDLFALEADEGKAWADLEMLTGRELIDSGSSASVASASSDTTVAKGGDR